MRFQKLFLRVVGFLAGVALPGTPSFALTDLDLVLTVSGSRSAAPVWQDSLNTIITTIPLIFSGAAGPAAANVDSDTVSAKLVNATYPATVFVTTPSSCFIGAAVVAAADVKVIYNAAVAAGTISVPLGLQSYGIRFLATGNYGDKVGVVTCGISGTLRYSY